jgi:CBS domain-containing protein
MGQQEKYPIGDYMSSHPITFKPDTSVSIVIDTLLEYEISGAPVINDDNHLVGMISERDCLGIYLDGCINGLPCGDTVDYMSRELSTVGPQTSIFDVAQKFTKIKCKILPVVDDDGLLLGIVTRHGVLHHIDKIFKMSMYHSKAA